MHTDLCAARSGRRPRDTDRGGSDGSPGAHDEKGRPLRPFPARRSGWGRQMRRLAGGLQQVGEASVGRQGLGGDWQAQISDATFVPSSSRIMILDEAVQKGRGRWSYASRKILLGRETRRHLAGATSPGATASCSSRCSSTGCSYGRFAQPLPRGRLAA